eukprot:XP_011432189.1 PREDICTED: tripartite motif-containing protein 2-like isoform X1 [Crassostrea gigas]
MSKQGEQWHREIDIIINRMKTEISEIKVKHRHILQKHLDEIRQIQSLIKETFLILMELERSTEVSLIIEYSSKNREFRNLQPKVQVKLPTFIPKPIDRNKLYTLVGEITPLSTATEEVSPLNQPNTSVRELLDEPEVVATVQTKNTVLRNVTFVGKDKIWTIGKSNDIKCFNINGSLLQTIKTKSGECPNDIAVDSNGNLLYSDGSAKTVNKVNINEKVEELIRFQKWVPGKMCVTSTGDLVVVMFSPDKTPPKVVRFSGSTEKQTIQFDDKGKPLYSGNDSIKYITENRNHDVCVADFGADAVVVVNQDGELRWRYTGHPSVSKNQPFKPWGITTDSQSRILTSDFQNHCIHIVDQNGQFLRCVDNCDLVYPTGLCMDNNDNLFVCEYYIGNVKEIKY